MSVSQKQNCGLALFCTFPPQRELELLCAVKPVSLILLHSHFCILGCSLPSVTLSVTKWTSPTHWLSLDFTRLLPLDQTNSSQRGSYSYKMNMCNHDLNWDNFILTGAVELPCYIIACLAMDKLGRRNTLIPFLILSALICVLIMFIPQVSHIWLEVFL